MNAKKSMNQETIDVKLLEDKGFDVLHFCIPGSKEGISVNLNKTSGQKEMKKVFESLLKIVINKDVALKLIIDEKYKKELFKEVCEEYISDLNKEIKDVRNEMNKI